MNYKAAKRLDRFQTGIFAAMDEKKSRLLASGRKVINLSIGTPDFQPPRHIMEAVSEAVKEPFNYRYSLTDTPEVLDTIVNYYEKRYGAHIFVGEFSAVAYAKGCDRWIADVGALLNEYGWDWCYHAFREWPGWSVEHVVTEGDSAATAKFAPSADTPRRRALLSVLKGSGK